MYRELRVFRKKLKMGDCKERIELMEKQILYFKGKKKENAKKEYIRLLMSCKKECGLEEPAYYKRA